MSLSPPAGWSDRSHMLAAALSRVALGDRAAFAHLYQASSAQLFGVILRINADRTQAEDILQECYITIWRMAGSFDPARAQPMTWLTSIARNRAIDSLRRRRAEPTMLSDAALGDDDDHSAAPSLLDSLASADAGPMEMLERAADAQSLTQCIGQLSAEQQQCLALAYYQGLSHAEVAQHLVQPLGTVKSWVRRALQALKDCLGHAAERSPERSPQG